MRAILFPTPYFESIFNPLPLKIKIKIKRVVDTRHDAEENVIPFINQVLHNETIRNNLFEIKIIKN